jgi:hypothetical protein
VTRSLERTGERGDRPDSGVFAAAPAARSSEETLRHF